MKKNILTAILMAAFLVSAFCGGAMGAEPVNVQEIGLDKIDTISVSYNSERITLFNSNTNTIILKEYMNINNSSYYAQISNSGNELVIKAGSRPVMRNFRARVEIFIPVSNKNIIIRTSSGNITGENEYTASSMKFNSSSGNIIIGTVNGDVSAESSSGRIEIKQISGSLAANTSSGNIIIGTVNGNVSAESSSGDIDIKQIKGSLTANTSSGRIRSENVGGSIEARTTSGGVSCSITENAGNVSITTSSGNVVLGIPQNFAFNFLSNTSSGRLRTPFPDKLSSPLTDRDSVQGIIGENTKEPKNISIRTNSGPITVNWIN